MGHCSAAPDAGVERPPRLAPRWVPSTIVSSPSANIESAGGRERVAWTLTALAAAACLTPWVRPEHALAVGVGLALLGFAPTAPMLRGVSRVLIQISVVLLGFSLNLRDLAAAGLTGAGWAIGTIAIVFFLGAILARMLRVDRELTTLVCSGTAICGGSAIAAVGAAIRASAGSISVAIGCVFLLNAAALWTFPALGRAMNLTPQQFGVWSAIAIHDVSSVVGAAASFSPESVTTATAVKLSRTLWIVPLAVCASVFFRRVRGGDPRTPGNAPGRVGSPVPLFIVLFVLASAAGTLVAPVADWAPALGQTAKRLMVLALLLVGLGLNRAALASVGWRPMVMATLLWAAISLVALVAVRVTVA